MSEEPKLEVVGSMAPDVFDSWLLDSGRAPTQGCECEHCTTPRTEPFYTFPVPIAPVVPACSCGRHAACLGNPRCKSKGGLRS